MTLSIITWTNNPEQYAQMKASVTFPAEFIAVGSEARSMAEAYTLGTARASHPWKIYCHQDVRFFCPDLPEQLAGLPTDVGLAGVAGSAETTSMSWWHTRRESWRGGVIQGAAPEAFGPCGPANNLDGLLLATDKPLAFPALPGLHFIDQWMCREAEAQGWRNWVIPATVQHLSQGTLDAAYYANMLRYQRRWFPGRGLADLPRMFLGLGDLQKQMALVHDT